MERKNAGRERDGEAQLAASRLLNREGQQASSRSSVSSPEGISNVIVPEGSNNITVPSDHDVVKKIAAAPIQTVHVDGARLKGDQPVIAKDLESCLCDCKDEAWVADLISSGILEAIQRRRKIKPRVKDMAVINEGPVRKTSEE